MVKRSSSKGPLARKIARAIEHGSVSITSLQVIEYIRAFKLRYPDSDIELAQPMIMARGYGDNPGLDYVQLVDSDVFEERRDRARRLVGPIRAMGERPAAVEGTGLVPCPLPGPRRRVPSLRRAFSFSSLFFVEYISFPTSSSLVASPSGFAASPLPVCRHF